MIRGSSYVASVLSFRISVFFDTGFAAQKFNDVVDCDQLSPLSPWRLSASLTAESTIIVWKTADASGRVSINVLSSAAPLTKKCQRLLSPGYYAAVRLSS